MTFRNVLFWIHLIAGCVAGLVVLAMSLTGVLLTYERQILAWADRGGFQAGPPATAGRRLPVEELLRRVTAARGPLPQNATMTLRSGALEPAEVSVGRGGAFYANTSTGITCSDYGPPFLYSSSC